MKSKMMIALLMVVSIFSSGPSAAGENGPFTISTSYNDFLSNPQGQGLLDTLMAELFTRINVQMTMIYTPTEKALVDVNAGLLDAELNRIQGLESSFPNLVRVPEPNMIMHFVAFANREIKIGGWESLKPFEIGMVRGWKILEQNTRGFPSTIRTPSEKELFTMLHKNRIDLALYAQQTGYAVIKELGYPGIFHLEPPLASRPMYLYVHKRHRDLVPLIARELKKMKADGSYQRIIEGRGPK